MLARIEEASKCGALRKKEFDTQELASFVSPVQASEPAGREDTIQEKSRVSDRHTCAQKYESFQHESHESGLG
jgi:hypothetical protein